MVLSVSVERKDNICGEICHKRCPWDQREGERGNAYVLYRENLFTLPCALSQPQAPLNSPRDRENKTWRFTTVSGHYDPCSHMGTNNTSFSFSCSKSLHKGKHLAAQHPKVPKVQNQCQPSSFPMPLGWPWPSAVLQISRTNITDFQRRISYLTKDMLQNCQDPILSCVPTKF